MGKIIGAKKGEVNRPTKFLAVFGIIAVLIVVCFGGYFLVTYIQGLQIAPATSVDKTTFVGYSYVDGEDVSWSHISIYTLKTTVEYPTSDDIRTLSNYDLKENTKDIDDISIDLSEIPYYIIRFNPAGDQYWAETYQLEFGMKNIANKELVLYHQATNISGTILDSSDMNEWDLDSALTHGLIQIDVLHESDNELHVGTDWSMSTADYADLTTVGQLFYQDQANYRCEFPTYSPLLDLDKDGQNDLELITDVFAVQFNFNRTISLIDGEVNQVNMTINDNSPIELAYSGTQIYMLFYRVIDFKSGVYSVAFDVSLAVNITCLSVKLVRVPTPYETSSLGTPVILSTFPLT